MNRAILLVGLALPLAACGSKPSVNEKNATVEDVSNKVREASRDQGLVRPGKWVSTVSVDKMDVPGVPPQVAEKMKAMVAQTRTAESCLTPEEAKQPAGNFFSANDNCRYDHFTMHAGKVDALMRCAQGGMTQVMRMTGTYSRNAYSMQMKSKSADGGNNGHGLSIEMSVNARRVGECGGKQG